MKRHDPARRRVLTALTGTAVAISASGCGFRLRSAQHADGTGLLPFGSLYIEADGDSTFVALLRQYVGASGTTVSPTAGAADARLQLVHNHRDRDILSLTGAGRVREYTLTQTVVFRLTKPDGEELLPATSIVARREYNFDDGHVIAREQEEALLIRDMEHDLVQKMLRRLAAVSR